MTRNNNNLEDFAKNYNDVLKDSNKSTFVDVPELLAIDHIFLDKRIKYHNEKIHSDSNDKGYMSDHYPISCEIDI